MKWIGQHIYDLISRFRNDVYLEDISTGTIASGAHLGLDSNNKIVKAADGGGDLTGIVAGTGLSGDDLSGPIPTLNVDAAQPTITTLAGLTSFGVAGVTTNIVAGDLTMYNAVNGGNPSFSIGANSGDRFVTTAVYNSGAQTLDSVNFQTFTTSSGTNDGRYIWYVDELEMAKIIDDGLVVSGYVNATGDGALLATKNSNASSATEGGKLRILCDDGAAMGNNHRLGVVEFQGAEDASGNRQTGASIQAMCDAAWSASENGTRLEFYTMDGDASSELSLTLDSDKLATFTGAVTVTGALTGTLATASQPNITTLAGLTSLGTAGATTDIAAGDLTMYNPVDNGNPTISVGKDANDRFAIETVYNSGAQTIDYINFQTYTTSSTNHDGRYSFTVDEVELAKIIDSGLYVTGTVQSLDADAQIQAIDTTASSATQGGKLRLISDDNAVMGDNHRLGVIQFEGAEDAGAGAGSNTLSIGARIQAIARDAWDGSNNDADLEFYTTDGTTESKVLTLDADKLATFTGAVTITGALTCTTDLATDQQKHLMHYNTTGYSNGSTEYQISESMNVNPVGNVEHDTNIGSDGLTGQTVQTWLRAGGHVMPRACTLKRWSGWSTSPTTGDDPEYGLFKVTLEDDVDSDPSAVLITEITHAASGNAIANFMTITTASSGDAADLDIAAGDIVFFAIKGGANFIYFNGTFEVEF